jgi:hypothetical protein
MEAPQQSLQKLSHHPYLIGSCQKMIFFSVKIELHVVMLIGIARVEANGKRRPLANSTDLQNQNRGLGILEIDIAIMLEALFCPKTQN